MQICSSLQGDKHTSTPPLSFLQAGCPSYRTTNSVKELKAPLGKLMVDKKGIKEPWKEYMEKLMNEENE